MPTPRRNEHNPMRVYIKYPLELFFYYFIYFTPLSYNHSDYHTVYTQDTSHNYWN